jgi:dienelactone hydrolase
VKLKAGALGSGQQIVFIADKEQVMKPLHFLLSAAFIVLISFTFVNEIQSSDAPASSDFSEVDFFKGTWECRIQGSPDNVFRWSVTEGLNNSWLVGFVQVGQNKVSNDFWRLVNRKIERFAFTGDGTFVKVDSNGWKSNKLRFIGSANQKTGEFEVRQTITRNSDREFRALWERIGDDRSWSVFSDELCTKLSSSELQPSSTSQALPFQLPAPSGRYKVGTTTYHWVDNSRRETYSAEIYDLQTQSLATTPRPSDRRELIVYVWYPTTAQGAAIDPYIDKGFALATAEGMGANFGVSPDRFVEIVTQTIQTNAVPKAKLAEASRYPVAIFSPGFGSTPKFYTKQLEELASHGYVVVAINPTYEAPILFPDGQVITQSSVFDFSSANSETEQQVFNRAVKIRAEDVSFVLNELERINSKDPQELLTGRLDLRQIGIFGHSLGGDTAIEAMKSDRRLKAGINMDGGSYGSLFASGNSDGLDRPFMVMSHDGADESLQSFYQRLKANAYRLTIKGSKHTTFMDFGLILPAFSTDSTDRDKSQIGQVIGSIEPQRAIQIISTYTLAFFNRYLKGEDEPLLEKLSVDYPEVLIESHS